MIEQNAPTWTDPKHPNDWRNTLARYVFPCFGKVLVSQVNIDHVLKALKPIWDTASGDGSTCAPAHSSDSGLADH